MGEHDDTGTRPGDAREVDEATGDTTPSTTGMARAEGEEPAGAPPEVPAEGLSPELIAQALRGAIQRKLAEMGLVGTDDGALEASGEAVERLRTGAKRVAVNLMEDLSQQLQRLADGALRPGGPKGGAAMARELNRQGSGEDNVIDLDAARRARAPGPLAEAEARIAGALRESFNRYLLEHAPPAEDGVPGHVKIDGAFVREHGGRLLASLFGSFAAAVLPPSVDVAAGDGGEEGEPSAETPRETAGGSAAAEPPGEAEAKESAPGPDDVRVVDVKLDLPGLFRDLMPPPPK